MEQVILFGAGKRLDMINQKSFMQYWQKDILAIIDNNSIRIGTEVKICDQNIPIIALSQITEFDDIPIIITSDNYYSEMYQQLILFGIKQQRIRNLEDIIQEYMKLFYHIEFLSGRGVEIGGPSELFESIYEKCQTCDGVNYKAVTLWSDNSSNRYRYHALDLGKQFILDATDLGQLASESYDFLLSSNNIEHLANPMQAIFEFYRVLKKGGILIILVPDKSVTFDHNREVVSFQHLLEDYEQQIKEDDLTHLSEILEKHDLSMDLGIETFEEFRERSVKNKDNRCLHHHVFSCEVLQAIAQFFNMELLENTEFFGNHLLVVKK